MKKDPISHEEQAHMDAKLSKSLAQSNPKVTPKAKALKQRVGMEIRKRK